MVVLRTTETKNPGFDPRLMHVHKINSNTSIYKPKPTTMSRLRLVHKVKSLMFLDETQNI